MAAPVAAADTPMPENGGVKDTAKGTAKGKAKGKGKAKAGGKKMLKGKKHRRQKPRPSKRRRPLRRARPSEQRRARPLRSRRRSQKKKKKNQRRSMKVMRIEKVYNSIPLGCRARTVIGLVWCVMFLDPPGPGTPTTKPAQGKAVPGPALVFANIFSIRRR